MTQRAHRPPRRWAYRGIGIILAVAENTAPIANGHSQAIWQSQVPREKEGWVFAVRRVVAWSLGPLGQVLAGLIALVSLDPMTGEPVGG